MERRVVITGLGVVSPPGVGAGALAEAVRDGRSAVRTLRRFDPSAFSSHVTGEVLEFDPAAGVRKDQSRYIKKNAKVMAVDIQMAVAASNLAILDSGLRIGDFKAKEPVLPDIDPARFGLVFGTNFIPTEIEDIARPVRAAAEDGEFDMTGWGERGIPQMFPLWLLKYLPNMHTCHTGVLWDARGPSNSLTCGDAGGLLALDEATRILTRGAADRMLAGGAESRVNPVLMLRMQMLGRLATTEGDPAAASRPFDAARTGFVAAEGAAILMLESAEGAEAREARVYGEILGCGASVTVAGVNACDPDGRATRLAVEAALDAAGVDPGNLGAVVAHGSAYPPQDTSEAAGLEAALGSAASRVPVTATKGVTGDMGAASGAADLAVLCKLARTRQVPPVLNCDDPAPDVALRLVRGEPAAMESDLALITSGGVGGQTAATVVRLNR